MGPGRGATVERSFHNFLLMYKQTRARSTVSACCTHSATQIFCTLCSTYPRSCRAARCSGGARRCWSESRSSPSPWLQSLRVASVRACACVCVIELTAMTGAPKRQGKTDRTAQHKPQPRLKSSRHASRPSGKSARLFSGKGTLHKLERE